ncbi:MAG: ATP-binding cassette domain-containing protein, partial [Spirochaetaceae bacterium]|nr:ATP-binding cassette domain-containing protein [Spirochaetaceae bacterium]
MQETSAARDVLVQAEGLRKYFPLKAGQPWNKQQVKAVDDVSFDIRRGETFGLVGESGCGKSTLGRVLVSLYPLSGGQVVFDGQDLTALPPGKLKTFRKKMQFIFQDPSASLNPRITVGNILLEPFRIHRFGTPEERRQKIAFLLDRVGLSS